MENKIIELDDCIAPAPKLKEEDYGIKGFPATSIRVDAAANSNDVMSVIANN